MLSRSQTSGPVSAAQEPSSLPAHRRRREQAPPRVAVIGAGPVGLEAALYASRLGFKVWLFEREAQIAPSVRAWGHVSLFTPWAANRSPLGESALREEGRAGRRPARPLPAGDLYHTGAEYVEHYLEPLARLLGEALVLETRVVALGRSYLFPEQHADAPQKRAARRFRLLTRSPWEERVFTADYVLDTSGVSHTPNWLGAGGLPALGEMGSAGRIFYGIPDVLGRDRVHFLGKRTLLVGDGASAATTALMLAEVLDLDPPGSAVWVTKSRAELPFTYLTDDPLPRRDLLFKKANLLVKQGHPRLEYLPVTQVEAVQHHLASGQFHVTLQVNHQTRRLEVDVVVANVGARPDASAYERFLQPGEPGLFVLGAKACAACGGEFFLAQGREQIRAAFRDITGDPALDLYAPADSAPSG